MAFQATSGETVTVFLEALGGTGTPAASYSATEKSTALGWYTITIAEALVGKFIWHSQDAVANVLSNGLVDLVDDTGTYFGYDPGNSSGSTADALTAFGVATEINLDTVKDQATIAASNTQT